MESTSRSDCSTDRNSNSPEYHAQSPLSSTSSTDLAGATERVGAHKLPPREDAANDNKLELVIEVQADQAQIKRVNTKLAGMDTKRPHLCLRL